jgi:hypothetical protein
MSYIVYTLKEFLELDPDTIIDRTSLNHGDYLESFEEFQRYQNDWRGADISHVVVDGDEGTITPVYFGSIAAVGDSTPGMIVGPCDGVAKLVMLGRDGSRDGDEPDVLD